MTDWFCWHVGTTGDPKFAVVAKKAKLPKVTVLAVWAYLLERAKVGTEQGIFGKFDPEDAAHQLEINERQVVSCLSALREKGLITETKIVNWNKRQYKPSTERTRAFRERRKHLETLGNGSEPFGTVQNGLEHAQDRTGQDNKKDITTTVPVPARAKAANGSNGHASVPKNGSSLDFNPLRASRAFRNGEPSKVEKHALFEQRTLRFALTHYSQDRYAELVRLQLSDDPGDKAKRKAAFNDADADYQARKAAGTLQPMAEF